jgi:hypothetical protein
VSIVKNASPQFYMGTTSITEAKRRATARPSQVTYVDQFCGAGGWSIGATDAGAKLSYAINHWKLAIETFHDHA